MKEIALKAHRYGESLPLLIKKNPSLVVKKHFTITATNLHNIKILLKNPLHFISLVFIKTVEYEAYLTGVLKYFLRK